MFAVTPFLGDITPFFKPGRHFGSYVVLLHGQHSGGNGRFFGISDKSCKIFFSEFYQIMPCIMFADN